MLRVLYGTTLTSNTFVDAVVIRAGRINPKYEHVAYSYLLLEPKDTPATLVDLTNYDVYEWNCRDVVQVLNSTGLAQSKRHVNLEVPRCGCVGEWGVQRWLAPSICKIGQRRT